MRKKMSVPPKQFFTVSCCRNGPVTLDCLRPPPLTMVKPMISRATCELFPRRHNHCTGTKCPHPCEQVVTVTTPVTGRECLEDLAMFSVLALGIVHDDVARARGVCLRAETW